MKLKLVEKRQEAKETKSFFWETEKPVNYLAGQYFYFTLPSLKYPDPRGATRHFTLSSSPTDGNILRNTTRIRPDSGYKKTLDEIDIGTLIDGEGPNGEFILDENEKGPHVFLAGGIGITPFRSMVKYAADKNLNTHIHLIYSDSTKEDMAFKKELEEISKSYLNVKIEFVFTKTEGRIDELKIKKFIENWKLIIANCIWWICGPPSMVEAMEQALGKLNVSSGNVRSEKFTGY